jgi:protein-tyrosine phosphatase
MDSEEKVPGIIDVHSHILPGLDDGPKDLDESLRMCRLYVAEGVTTVVATPHVCDRRFHVTPEAVRAGALLLSEACRYHGLDLEILPGSDVRLEPELPDSVDEEEVLTLGDNERYLLLELPLQTAPPIEGIMEDLAARGITPILSHPERNMELMRKPERLGELVEAGFLVQITADSLFGDFGEGSRLAAEWFLKEDFVHVVASDAHSSKVRRPRLRRAERLLTSIAGGETACKLLRANPAAIIHGETIAERADRTEQREAEVTESITRIAGGSGRGITEADIITT